MGVVSVTTFSTDTETVTKTKLNGLAANLVTEFNGSIDNANIKAAAGIVGSKLNLAIPGAIGGTTPAAGAFTTLSATGAVTLTNTATTADIAAIVGNSLTTGKGLSLTSTSTARTEDNLLHVTHVGDSAGANTGGVGYFESDDNDTGTRDVVGIKNTDASATGATCLGIDQVSTNAGVDVNCTGNGPHLRMIGDPTVASPTDGDLWFTGSALNFRNGAATVNLLPQNGQVVAHSYTVSTADEDLTLPSIGNDDTVPQWAETDELEGIATTHVAKSATNVLKIDVTVNYNIVASAPITFCLFKNGAGGAISAATHCIHDSTNNYYTHSFTFLLVSGTTDSTIYNLGIGEVGGTDTIYINQGSGGAAKLGDTLFCSMSITEIHAS